MKDLLKSYVQLGKAILAGVLVAPAAIVIVALVTLLVKYSFALVSWLWSL